MSQWMITEELFHDSQRVIIDETINQKVLAVFGPPGSGKTLVAVYYLRKLLRKNESAVLIVFTHILHRFIQSGLETLELPLSNAVLAYNFFKNSKTFGYLIVDEFQDFPLNEKMKERAGTKSGSLTEYIDRAEKGLLLAGDLRQRIYQNKESLRWETKDLKMEIDCYCEKESRVLAFDYRILQEHFRLPKAITDVAAALLPAAEAEKLRNHTLNEDASAQVWKVKSPTAADKASIIKKVVVNRGFTSVGVLVWNISEGEKIMNSLRNVGLKVYDCLSQDGKKSVDFNDKTIKIMNVHSAKGVQFDCVFLPFGEKNVDKPELAYVAVTRPLKMLGILYSEKLASPFLEISEEILPHL